MKINELKNFVKEKCNEVKINDYSKSILLNVKGNEVNNVATYNKSKKYLRPLVACCSAIVLSFASFATINFIDNLPSKNYIEEVSKAKELLSYEVSALGNIMSSNSLSSIKRQKLVDYSVSDANDYADEIHSYLVTGEMLFNKDNFSAVHEENDNPLYSYQHKLVVTYDYEGGHSSNYTMYFDEHKKFESEKDIDEVSTTLDGIMIVNEIEYIVKGEKIVDEDNYETTLKIYTTEDSYIEISQETEINENEYKYEFVEDGKTVKEITLDLDKSILSKKMDIIINEDYKEKVYSFDYKEDYISCEYTDIINEVEFNINIQIYEKFYLYVFSNEIKIIKEK